MFKSQFGTAARTATVDVCRRRLTTAPLHMLARSCAVVNTQVFPAVRTDLVIRGLDHVYKTDLLGI